MLEVKDLRRRGLEADRWLIDNVCLTVAPGERIALMGPSGSGKSLLLKMLALLEHFDSGEIKWLGHNVAPRDVPRYRTRVAYLPQRPLIIGHARVRDYLQSIFRFKVHADKKFDDALVGSWLVRCGLEANFLDRRVAHLSGGETQLASLFRLLQTNPQIILLDEATSALDAARAKAVEELMSSWLAEDSERAYLWITHAPDQATRIASRRLIMAKGKLLATGANGTESEQLAFSSQD